MNKAKAILNNKKGSGMVLLIIFMLLFIFPVVIFSLIDLSNTHKIAKDLKRSLNAATKSASLQVDESKVPDGVFVIDENQAKQVFVDIFDSNFKITSTDAGGFRYYQSDTDNEVRYYVAVYNGKKLNNQFDLFPASGQIPEAVTDRLIQIKVNRPTVFAIAVVKYHTTLVMGNRDVYITQIASSQLNYIPIDKQESYYRQID